jgi:L-asparagine transporter-like permease
MAFTTKETLMSQFHDISEREKGMKRQLSASQMGMIAIGGAIGTGLFMGSGFAISFAGPSVLLSYAIGGFITLLLMGCLAEMTVAHPTSGSFGAWAEHYVAPWAGFLVRYAYWFAIVLGIGTEVTAIGVYMHYWFPEVPQWICVFLFSAALIGVNVMSVKAFGAVEYVFSAVKVAAIVGFIVISSYVVFGSRPEGVGFHNYVADGGFFPKGGWGMWQGVIIAIFSYLGIEMIAVAAGEAEDPSHAVIKAFRITMVRLVLFYLLTIALMLAIVPWQSAGTDKSPFVKVMEIIGIPGAAGVINFVVLVAAMSAMNSQLYITTRMMFSLSRGGYAHPAFGKLSSRGVPVASLALSCIGIAVATIVNIFEPKTSFMVMIAISMFGAMFNWMMIFVTHWFFRRRWVAQGNAPLRFRMWGFPWLTLLGAALVFAVLVSTAFTEAFKMTLMIGVPALILLAIVYFLFYQQNEGKK